MKASADNRSCRSLARWIGVWPDGAHVRRRAGWSMKPLSSKKIMGLPLRLAPFLFGANPVCASAPWPHRRPPAPDVEASQPNHPGMYTIRLPAARAIRAPKQVITWLAAAQTKRVSGDA